MTVLVLSGAIGAGKSTLTQIIADELGTTPFFEEVQDNPILPLFYENPEKYAFLLQIFFLNKRFASIKKALSHRHNVLDRSIYEDALFFQMNADMGRATEVEVDLYNELLDNMMEELEGMPKKHPDLLIHISVSYETMIKRIKKRGRSYEQIDQNPDLEDYYQRLLDYYQPWYSNYHYSEKMVIDGDKYDFIANEQDRQTVIQLIKDKLKTLDQD
ncbi:deoxynucleoside kinase [Holzapfeliella sp. He02]|uniref:Deoxynucleoside kinase n=1 Tax=Holzapfeliella saturejae TaxID=3082953 RepID=A0ABU8SEJ7_9LACO